MRHRIALSQPPPASTSVHGLLPCKPVCVSCRPAMRPMTLTLRWDTTCLTAPGWCDVGVMPASECGVTLTVLPHCVHGFDGGYHH